MHGRSASLAPFALALTLVGVRRSRLGTPDRIVVVLEANVTLMGPAIGARQSAVSPIVSNAYFVASTVMGEGPIRPETALVFARGFRGPSLPTRAPTAPLAGTPAAPPACLVLPVPCAR